MMFFEVFISEFNEKVVEEYNNDYYIRKEVFEWLVSFAEKSLFRWDRDNRACFFYFKNKNDAMLFKLTWS